MGVFDGNGHAIFHLTITGAGQDYFALFGQLGFGAEVKNLGVVDARISGLNDRGGILAGTNYGVVTQCYGAGSVSGFSNVGGLVGENSFGGTVANCYSTGVVTATGDRVGGLVGYARQGSAAACFWDTQTSGLSVSASGVGKTTAEMHTAKTFLEVGWDFVGETKNGTADIWWIDEGKDYPRLWWERPSKSFMAVGAVP